MIINIEKFVEGLLLLKSRIIERNQRGLALDEKRNTLKCKRNEKKSLKYRFLVFYYDLLWKVDLDAI